MKHIFLLLSAVILTGHSLTGQFFNDENRSIYSDIKAHNVGDVVTVLIVETANASRESKINSSSKTDVDVNGSVTGDLGNLTKFLPIFGASSKLANSHDGSEGTQQKEKLTGKISARIVEKTKEGMLKIEGERTVEVNGETNLMKLTGLIRARDIKPDNIVYSYNIADAKIIYKKSGFRNKIAKPGTFQRWGTWLVGIGLIILSVYGSIS